MPDHAYNPEEKTFYEAASTEPHRALYETWQQSALQPEDPDADRELQQALLQRCINDACEATADKHRRSQLRDFGEATSYLWFGDQDTPLPSCLMHADLPDRRLPELRFRVESLTDYEYHAIARHLEHFGFAELVNHRRGLLGKQMDMLVQPLARALITNTPAYRLLESFISPAYEEQDRPLSALERLIKEQAAEERVRRQHSLSPYDDLALHPLARTAVARALHVLDEQTQRGRIEAERSGNPLERARLFFWGIAGQLEKSNTVRAVETLLIPRPETDEGYTKSIYITTDENMAKPRRSTHDPTSFATMLEGAPLPPATYACLDFISEQLISGVVLDIFDERMPRDYDLLLRQRLGDQIHDLYKDLVLLAVGKETRSSFARLATLLKTPCEATDAFGSLITTTQVARPFNETLATKKEVRRLLRGERGIVRARPASDQTMRLILHARRNRDLPPADPNADLLIEWHEPAVYDLQVPGYKLTGRSDGLFAFTYRPAADPYAPCNVPIDAEARRELASQYAQGGLTALGQAVESTPDLTVGQLVQLIAAHTKYVVPGDTRPQPLPSRIEEYLPYIQKGTLALQCVGAAHLVKLSLNEIFGYEASTVINGDTLPGVSKRITKAGHVQTAFTDPKTNSFYLLDGTPSGFAPVFWRSQMRGLLVQLRGQLAPDGTAALDRRQAPQAVAKVAVAATLSPPTMRSRQEYFKQQAEGIRDALLLNLRIIFGSDGQLLSVEDTLARVAALPDDDLTFRTFSMAWRAPNGEDTQLAARRLADHIRNVGNCRDETILRDVDPRNYTRKPRLIAALRQTAESLAQLHV